MFGNLSNSINLSIPLLAKCISVVSLACLLFLIGITCHGSPKVVSF